MSKHSIILFITKRLVFSSRNKGIVKVISLISLVGVAVGSFALVLVLSVFNGFTDVAKTMFEKTSPPLLIEQTKGNIIDIKTISFNTTSHDDYYILPIVKTTAMVSVGEQRSIVTLMGIDEKYFLFNALDSCIVNGKHIFDIKDSLFCLMGVNQATMLGLNKGAEKMNIALKLTVPATKYKNAMVIEDKLSSINVFYQASFQSHSELDEGFVFTSIDKARELLDMEENTCNSIYIIPKNKLRTDKIKADLENQLGREYSIKTILEQQAVYFRIVKSEKLAVYIILAFIIFIATINIVSSIIILYIQKDKMNKILCAVGMQMRDLRNIYFLYGMFINVLGSLLGIALGLLLCFLQQQFGLIKLAQDAFVVDAFPIKILVKDIVAVFILVISIGSLSIWAITSRIRGF